MTALRPFCMPKWGIEMTEGTVAEWMVKEGDRIEKGDVLCLIETAKITNEIEAERDGVMLKILSTSGDEQLPVGTLLAVIGDAFTSEADVAAFIAQFVPAEGAADPVTGDRPAAASKSATEKIETNLPISPKALALAEAEGVDITAVSGSGRSGRITFQDVHQHIRPPAKPILRGPVELRGESRAIFASPLARRLAAIHGIDLSGLSGTSPRGRISKHDVLAQVAIIPATMPRQDFAVVSNAPRIEPFDKIRKIVARRLAAAKQDIPHFYLKVSVAVDELIKLRRTANVVLGCKASLNDYLVWAVAKALVQHGEINVQVHGEDLYYFEHADVAVAVASPKGLVTPIVRQADRMRIDQLATASSALIEKAKAGRLGYEDLDGGTFTVSNLGMFGIEEFSAIINPPQAAILAVGKASRQLSTLDDGEVGYETRIALTLSVDHRAIDGAAGAQFLATLKGLIEAPEVLFE